MEKPSKLAAMQPYLFPYLGYFQLIKAVDNFVLLNDVGYFKKGWLHRNQILLNNVPFLFTIPIIKASQNRKINQHIIMSGWSEELNKTFKHAYSKAPFYEENKDIIKICLSVCENRNLSDAAEIVLKELCHILDLNVNFHLSSNLNTGYKIRQHRIIELCKKFNAETYINPIGGKEINMYYHDDFYPINLRFIERLDDWGNYSIIHYLFLKGRQATKQILNEYKLIN